MIWRLLSDMNKRDVPEVDAKRTRRLVLEYLEGEQDLQLVIGAILGAGDMEAARLFIRDLTGYGDAVRYGQLVRWVETQP
jgi:hypothetical protein